MRDLPFTGERFVPSERGQIAYEHYHRYAACVEAARGKVVLDIACGEGFGSALLARNAAKVIGIDVDAVTVRHATEMYGHLRNVSFVIGDCRAIPLETNSVDFIVSFETIEHIDEHDQMLAELGRVLRPNGALIISSPNKGNYSDKQNYKNPFHVRELTYAQFVRLLRNHFAHVRVYRQQLESASFILADGRNGPELLQSFMVGQRGVKKGSQSLKESRYSIAVCAQSTLASASVAFRPSVHLDPNDNLFLQKEKALQQLIAEDQRLQAQSTSLNRRLAETQADLQRHQQALAETQADLQRHKQALAETQADLQRSIWHILANWKRRISITVKHGIKTLLLRLRKTYSTLKRLPQHIPASWKRRIPIYLKHRIKTRLSGLQHVAQSYAGGLGSITSTELPLPRMLLASWVNQTRAPTDLVVARRILEESGIFEKGWYRQVAGLGTNADPVEHYLVRGWRTDSLEPCQNFNGRALYKYYQSVGFDDAPALTFATLRANGWPVYRTLAEAEEIAKFVRSNEMFDAKAYATRVCNLGDLDPALHYTIVGERFGYAPGADFDPVYYLDRYPDLASWSNCLLLHYILHGRQDGRRRKSVASELRISLRGLDPQRETILVISHQATRTGAPILAYNIALRLRQKYNVATLLLAGGNLVETFESCSDVVIGPLNYADWHPVEMDYLVTRLTGSYQFTYAIANSIDTRIVMKSLTCAFVPVVALVHEFSDYLSPPGELGRALEWATKIVFSAARVAASVKTDYPSIDNRPIHILPQGPSSLPVTTDQKRMQEAALLRTAMRPAGFGDAIVVLGCGTIFPRKGVDLFVSCAAAVAAMTLKRPVRFVWIGKRLPEDIDQNYYRNLVKQIARLGLSKTVALVDEVENLEAAYALADVFFLSSRLDPLPNVAIDSALRGLPVVCFENASGFADILSTDTTTKLGVVKHLDVQAAAELIVKLTVDEAARLELGGATRRLAQATFDMEHYAKSLDGLGREAAQEMLHRRADFETIKNDPTFDLDFIVEPDSPAITRDQAIRVFLARAAALGTGKHPSTNFYYRRPCPGFHPQIYALENSNRYDTAVVNPLAHFIRSGKPDGPWKHSVVTPANIDGQVVREANLRTALHVHFHYPELYTDFQEKLSSNQSRCDLLLSTNNKRKAEILRRAVTNYGGGKAIVRIVPNRGRDIGAFLTAFGKDIADQYDIIGHLHSKRSLFLGNSLIGERWREFLWQNMLGGLYPMMDIVLDRFAKDERLGIIFPDDPHLSDWDLNRKVAEQLAKRMRIDELLPPFFDFPVGTMFWGRTNALAPLLKLKLNWSDYPKEPAPIDGTILHALERLLPFVARHQGYHYASTNIPGVTW